MLFFRNSTTVSLFLCRVRTIQFYIRLRNHKRSRFRLTQLGKDLPLGCTNLVYFCYKFISLMPDDNLEKKGSNKKKKCNMEIL